MRTVKIPNDILLGQVRQLINKGHTVTILVKGNSMRPFLEGGRDSVELAYAGTLKKGDIVLAEITPGKYVLHRIIKIYGTSLTLMGDGNLRETETCSAENIAGITIAVIRKGKKIDCRSRKWKNLSMFWFTMRPMRRYLLAIYRQFI